jgi:ABC-type Fe3+ transport system permease subunit
MRRKIHHAFREGRRFRKEFRRQLRLLILVTLGFTIAFTWRQTIFDVAKEFVQFVTDIQNSATLSILSSVLITLISILLIYLTSHALKDTFDDH